MSEETMTIREMCDAYDVTARTLRFYEAKELLSPIRIGQRRLYTKGDRARLKLILRGKRFGFKLEEIRELLDLYDRNDPEFTQLTTAYEAAARRLADLKDQRDALDAAIDDLEDQMRWADRFLTQIHTARASASGDS